MLVEKEIRIALNDVKVKKRYAFAKTNRMYLWMSIPGEGVIRQYQTGDWTKDSLTTLIDRLTGKDDTFGAARWNRY